MFAKIKKNVTRNRYLTIVLKVPGLLNFDMALNGPIEKSTAEMHPQYSL
jgi:hypothetical protein